MGFELNKLMRQFGVSTPGVVNYSGAVAPVAPLEPIKDSDESIPALRTLRRVVKDAEYDDAMTQYKKDLAAYEAIKGPQTAAATADRAAYDTYRNAYMNRIMNTPQYMDAQYQSAFPAAVVRNPTQTGNLISAPTYGTTTGGAAGSLPAGVNAGTNWIGGTGGGNLGGVNVVNTPTMTSPAPKMPASYDQAYVDQLIREAAQQAGGTLSYADALNAATNLGIPASMLTSPLITKAPVNQPQANAIRVQSAYGPNSTAAAALGASHIADGVQLIPGAPGYDPAKAAMRQAEISTYGGGAGSGAADTLKANNLYGTGMSQWQTELNRLHQQDVAAERVPVGTPAPVAAAPTTPQMPASFDQSYVNQLIKEAAQQAGGTLSFADASNAARNLGIPVSMLTSPLITGARNFAHGGSVHDLAAKYAEGGQVKTNYRTAGAVKLPSGYGSEEEEADFAQRFFQPSADVEVTPVNMDSPPPPMITQLPERATPQPSPAVNAIPEEAAPLTKVALDAIKTSSEPMAPAAAPVAPVASAKSPAAMSDRMAGIQSLLAAYGPKESAYGEDLKAARATAKAESDAFATMLNRAMKSPEDEKASKAEIYFRLAAAFGSPTKTGQFSENLGMVGKELGEYSKGKRASAQQKLALSLEGQKMRMATAKEDLRSLQALAGEEMKDKRTIATELLKDYIKSGEPQSAAGKQALDEGLKPGTPEYQKRVGEIGNLNVEGKMAQISATLQNLSLSQANFALNQDKFTNQKAQQSKLTGPELKLKTEAEDLIASSKQSLADLKQAYALNPNSLAGGWLDKGQQFLGEAAGSKDPTIVNTRILNNLLGSQGLAKLKATFGGAPTEGERAILMELEGIGSKTKEERSAIIKRAYKVLQDRVAREQTRLDQITSGAYRTTTPLEGGTD